MFLLVACSFDSTIISLPVEKENYKNSNKIMSDIELMTENLQNYISNMGNLRGKFIQKSSNGEQQKGDFYISIPGRMRIDYENSISILADGHDFIYYDSSNDQITMLDLQSSPAGILLSNNSLDSIGAKIKKVIRRGDISYLYIYINNNMLNTQIVFKVKEKPFELKGWIVQDIQGITTDFSIVDLKRITHDFDKNLFILKRKRSYTPGSIRLSDDY